MSEEQANQDTSDPGQVDASQDPQASTPEDSAEVAESSDSSEVSDSSEPADSSVQADSSESAGEETPSPDASTDDAQGSDAGGDGDGESSAFDLPDLGGSDDRPGAFSNPMDLLSDVDLNVKIELGRTQMLVEDVLKLKSGCVVELDKLAGDPVDIYVNDRLVARGEVLVLNDNFCVRVNELVSSKQAEGRRKSA